MGESTEMFYEPSENSTVQHISESMDANQRVGNLLQGNLIDASPLTSWLRESVMKFQSSLRNQSSHLPLILVIVFAVIFIMQVFNLNQIGQLFIIIC